MTRSFRVSITLGGLSLLLGASSARAEDIEVLKARVPFAFVVGGATLPAGEYELSFDDAKMPGALRLRSQSGHGIFVLTSKSDLPRGSEDEPRLVFEKKEDRYVLTEVLDPGNGFGIEVLGPKPAAKDADRPGRLSD